MALQRNVLLVSIVSLSACSGDEAPADGSESSDSGGPSSGSLSTTQHITSAPADESSTAAPETASSGGSSSADASSSSSGEDGLVDCDDLPASINADGLLAHLTALEQIAIDNGGNRAVGTPGYDASLEYVRMQMESYGYTTTPQAFDVEVFSSLGPSSLSWQGVADYDEGDDFLVATYSAAGTVTDVAQAVDIQLGPGNGSTSGCEAGDFAGFEAGRIAVIQRGTCFTATKVTNAQAAGATGAIIFNQGDSEDREGVWLSTLGADTDVTIPVVLTSYAIGTAMAQATPGSVTASLDVDAGIETTPSASLIVENASGDPNDVIMLGAHLDSVPAGPGINDNGSGTAVLLEVARAMASCESTRRVRFAWWGAEEVGLVGSRHYVDSLDMMQRQAIAVYLNFDMVASPNWVRFRYDGDGSAYGTVGPMGSAELEQVFADWFDGMGLETVESPFDGRSDYGPFIAAGIASGGLGTGAEGIKTAEQAAVHGGQAGQAYDPCYHGACDTLDNASL
ncbi:MAG: M20/M25/M40 family metallo-hydrolase, partial [Deltaproteobacteria bacterium]|nr:M20/M25/M40 family metallo-hydrolase [Nannocystaceae bacterium]